MRLRAASALTILLLLGCSSSSGDDAEGPGTDDAASSDTGFQPASDDAGDAASPSDSTAPDGSTPDGSTPDATTPDGSTPPGDSVTPPPSSSGQWVIGYYAAYNMDRYPIASIDWAGMTHVALAGLGVNGSGAITTTFANFATDAEGATFAKQMSTAAHAHGAKALLMLGGAGLSDNVKPAMSKLDSFVSSLVKVTSDLGYDGIDLDVEASNFTLDDAVTLAAALRAKSPTLILTYPGSTLQYGQAVDARIVKLATYLDRYNMQSYMGGNVGMFTGGDGAGGRFESWFYGALGDVSNHRPYSIDYALQQFAAAGIPKGKLGMGISFYAACYKTPDTTPPGGSAISGPRMPTGASSDWCWDCGIGGGDNTSSYNYFYAGGGVLATATATERKWDDVAQVPYLSFAAPKSVSWCGGNTRFVTYEDEKSIKAKGAFSRTKGYGGVIVWTIDQGWLPSGAADGRPQNALMQALHDGFLAP